MEYNRWNIKGFYDLMREEKMARDLVWKSRFDGADFQCPHCGHHEYYQYRSRPEIRKCKGCMRQIRLKAGTIFRDSKVSILDWLQALSFMMQGKRGISAMELKRQLEIKSYSTAWGMLHKIRDGLRQRDELYKLKGVVELDGSQFSKRKDYSQTTVLVAIESRDWIDERGRHKSRAGFAKIRMTRESNLCAQWFVDAVLEAGTMINTDGNNSYMNLKHFNVDYQIVSGDPEILDRWLPWVHKFVSNAKRWILGTHHGVGTKNIGRYLAEFAYRFNRRHDPKSLIHRALTACCLGKPITLGALSG